MIFEFNHWKLQKRKPRRCSTRCWCALEQPELLALVADQQRATASVGTTASIISDTIMHATPLSRKLRKKPAEPAVELRRQKKPKLVTVKTSRGAMNAYLHLEVSHYVKPFIAPSPPVTGVAAAQDTHESSSLPPPVQLPPAEMDDPSLPSGAPSQSLLRQWSACKLDVVLWTVQIQRSRPSLIGDAHFGENSCGNECTSLGALER